VTDQTDLAMQAFGVNVLAFVRKKNLENEVQELVCKIRKEIFLRYSLIFMTAKGRYVRVSPAQLRFAILRDRHVELYLTEQHIVLKKMSIDKVFGMFPENSCVFISRDCFVSIPKILKIDRSDLYLEGITKPLHICRGRLAEVKRQFFPTDE
jgi:DNA-binding LytR/AlgR family response regulator